MGGVSSDSEKCFKSASISEIPEDSRNVVLTSNGLFGLSEVHDSSPEPFEEVLPA